MKIRGGDAYVPDKGKQNRCRNRVDQNHHRNRQNNLISSTEVGRVPRKLPAKSIENLRRLWAGVATDGFKNPRVTQYYTLPANLIQLY